MQTLFAVQRVSAISISEIVSSIANTVCESSCVQIDSTPNAVDPAHTAATVQFAVSAAAAPTGRAQGQGHWRACRVHAVAHAGSGTGCGPVARWESRMRSAHGATTGRSRSDHGATTEHVTERPRSGAERYHGAARRFPTEQLRGTGTELLRGPPRGATHGAATEQLREAACELLSLAITQ